MTTPQYIACSRTPALAVTWLDDDGSVVPLQGVAITARVGLPGQPARAEKTSGVTGADAAPNVVIEWGAGELAAIGPGLWTVELEAATGPGPRKVQFPLRIKAQIGAPS